jgi:hypothetical protein
MQRVQSIGSALAVLLLLGCTAPVADVTTPPAPTLYAPEDLASSLPRQVRGKTLTVSSSTVEELTDTWWADPERSFLVERGKDVTDVWDSRAMWFDEASFLVIWAQRVRGVPADELAAEMLTVLEESSNESMTVGGRPVRGWANETGASYVYMQGEVIYMITASNPQLGEARADADAAVAALP